MPTLTNGEITERQRTFIPNDISCAWRMNIAAPGATLGTNFVRVVRRSR